MWTSDTRNRCAYIGSLRGVKDLYLLNVPNSECIECQHSYAPNLATMPVEVDALGFAGLGKC